MTAKELVNHIIPLLKPSDSVAGALQIMQNSRVFELPVVDNGTFLGLLTEDRLLETNAEYLKEIQPDNPLAIVTQDQHYYEILNIVFIKEVTLVAVADLAGKYAGAIAYEDLIKAFTLTSAVRSPGSMVTISLDSVDYSHTEISRLIEENGAKILSSYVISDDLDPMKMKLVIKLNKEEISHVMSTLSRFGYLVDTNYKQNAQDVYEQERLNSLMNFLDL